LSATVPGERAAGACWLSGPAESGTAATTAESAVAAIAAHDAGRCAIDASARAAAAAESTVAPGAGDDRIHAIAPTTTAPSTTIVPVTANPGHCDRGIIR
jgi:hypothetical protein